ncbi:hypothetical protein CCH79_00011635 [Gambusia affinis]|uniref:PLC-beta PH domain-containing protein n=1 Tax=Gambusia affinis TaxID=33528 RepID=A0A315VU74_GAMAF|nr:hypothetical protein CCH79_00011635 [Gambusia affinis]
MARQTGSDITSDCRWGSRRAGAKFESESWGVFWWRRGLARPTFGVLSPRHRCRGFDSRSQRPLPHVFLALFPDPKLREKLSYEKERLESNLLTIVYGVDMVNVSFMYLLGLDEKTTQIWTDELFDLATNILSRNSSRIRHLYKARLTGKGETERGKDMGQQGPGIEPATAASRTQGLQMRVALLRHHSTPHKDFFNENEIWLRLLSNFSMTCRTWSRFRGGYSTSFSLESRCLSLRNSRNWSREMNGFLRAPLNDKTVSLRSDPKSPSD